MATRAVRAIRFLADPRAANSVKAAEKLLDPYGFMPPRKVRARLVLVGVRKADGALIGCCSFWW